MKLHAITLENLSSLYGEHTVDLEADLHDAPLFVIVGPTGAGKSTLLDAVSLALFGETPRLDNTRARDKADDGDSRHIMSRGTGACRATLVFSRLDPTGARVRYRATWACHRANQQADGAFQTPRRSLERLDDGGDDAWTVLVDDHRKKFTEPHFDAALDGLTVADFQRSILLAQGAFTALLRAGTEEKAAILERLTSTEIYADLGRRANRMRVEATRAFDQVDARLEGMQLLGPEELAALEEQVEAAQTRVDTCRADLERVEREAAWLARAEALADERVEAEADLAAAVMAFDEAAPSRERLAEDARARPAAELRAATARDAAEIRALAERLGALDARRERLTEDLEAASAAERAAADAHAAAAAEKIAAEPTLAEARRLAEAARQTAHTQRAADAALARASDERDRADAERAEVIARADAARAALDQATARAEALASRRALADALSGLEARAARLGDDDRRLRSAAAELEAARADARAAAQAEAEAEAARRAVEAELEALPASPTAPPEDPDRALSTLSRTVERLAEATRLAAARRALRERRVAREAEREALVGSIAASRAAAATERQALALLRVEIEGLAARRDDLELAVSLGEHRARLVDGAPCPLCGSEAHPWRGDEALHAQDAKLRASRDDVVERLAVGREAATRRERALAGHDKALARDEGLRARLDDDLADLVAEEAEVDARLMALLGPEEAAEADSARGELSLGERLAVARTEQRALAEAVRAQQSRRLLAERTAHAAQRVRALAEQREGARERARARAEALSREVAAGEARARELAAAIAGFGVEVPMGGDRPDLRAALRRASQEVDAWRRAVEAREAAASAATAEERALERAVARVEAAADRVEALSAEAAGAAVAAAEAAEVSAAALGGEAVEAVVARLDRAEAAARGALDPARAATAEVEREAAEVAGKASELAARRAEVAARAEAGALAFAEALESLGLPDEGALDALLLDEGAREELEAEVAELTRRRERADDALARVAGRIAAHGEARPASLGAGVVEAQVAAVRVGPARAALDDANRALGARQGELDRHHATARKHADIKVEWDSRRETMLLWKRLHRLIGEGDGKAFQEFAQILNLQELVDRANHHLRALAPRYALITATDREGMPRLDFAIRDTWLAGRRRPITTLSGGETFLVSLALALGLADMRAVGMPIETLLLDEGFGTLDPRALDTAVEALERLNAKSRVQVGIISHVEGLRERVEARVVVEPLGNGRSRLRSEIGAPRRPENLEA